MQRQAAADAPRRARDQVVATCGLYSPIDDPRLVFELISDPLQSVQGERPRFVQDEDVGKLFMERSNGEPNKPSRPRRGRGLDAWRQGDFLWMRPVSGVSYGPNAAGSVWVRAYYGTVECKRRALAAADSKAGESGSNPLNVELTTYKTHIFDLCYFNVDGPTGQVSEILQRGGTAAKSHYAAAMLHASWVQGTLYHFRERYRGSPVAQSKTAPTGRAAAAPPVHAPRLEQPAHPPRVVQQNPGSLALGDGAPGGASSSVVGRVDMSLDGHDARNRWLQFNDAQGQDIGALQLTEGKYLELTGTSGDFAEYHLRDPSQDPFEEGDLIGFGADGLTRRTDGKDIGQLGVISRRAIVKGSRPTSVNDISKYDSVAYMGIVPVKVRGRVSKDDFIVPSGRNDGTGIAVSVSRVPPASVGRANSIELQTRQSVAAIVCAAVCSNSRSVCRKTKAWELASIVVLNPVNTISGSQRWYYGRAMRYLKICIVLMLVSWCVLLGSGISSQSSCGVTVENGIQVKTPCREYYE
jgi:hypothetical protein